MELQRVTLEQAKKLAQVGFHEEHKFPTVALALKWMRDTHNTIICFDPWWEMGHITYITVMWNIDVGTQKVGEFNSYEEAESAGLDWCLDYLIKQKEQ